MKIKNHFLVPDDGDNVQIRKSPNLSTPFTPLLLVIHYTANNSLDETVSWFMNPDAQASSHLVIGRDGRIVQMVAFNKKAWHAGASSWGNLEGINRYSIGIELVNAGKLRRRSDDKWVNWAGRVVPDEEVTEAVH
ncbi:MAG TPA: N-acetylmuramoyl-L-alanine amidase, partial [Spirochaetota bacterium]|nr:N-acetylmuramoyl-L-alanine amidase [Spirochaetota bacterium]